MARCAKAGFGIQTGMLGFTVTKTASWHVTLGKTPTTSIGAEFGFTSRS